MNIVGDGGHAVVVRDVAARCGASEGTFIAIGDNEARKKEAENAKGDFFPVLVHPSAVISDLNIGEGSIIMAGAVLQPRVKIGRHCIVNSGATVDHHCIIGDFVHIGPGAHLCGNVTVGEGALIGVGVGIAPGAVIPAWSLVKARRLEICPMR
jgi:sugar O-acyltransferase (sialic acid O-acetyltransferase NeuD family)